MMLAIENLDADTDSDRGKLELAMLLDEPPAREYMQGFTGGHPWRSNSPLVRSLFDARMHGYSWLYIVYKGDAPHTWGSKRVKVVFGGKIYGYKKNALGNITDTERALRFESVAPEIFMPVNQVFGAETKLSYRVVSDCTMSRHPDEDETQPRYPHPLLGYSERSASKKKQQTHTRMGVKYIPDDLGCRIDWINEKRYGESWFLQDAAGLDGYRFELTEYQRRPFVKHVLRHLGFVKADTSDSPTGDIDIDVGEQQNSENMLSVSAHVQKVSHSLVALGELLANREKNKSKKSTPPSPELPKKDSIQIAVEEGKVKKKPRKLHRKGSGKEKETPRKADTHSEQEIEMEIPAAGGKAGRKKNLQKARSTGDADGVEVDSMHVVGDPAVARSRPNKRDRRTKMDLVEHDAARNRARNL